MDDTNENAIYRGYYNFVTTREYNTFSKIAKRYYGINAYAFNIAMYSDMKEFNVDYPLEPGISLKIPVYPECIGYKIFKVRLRVDFITQKLRTIANMIDGALFHCLENDCYYVFNGTSFVQALELDVDTVDGRELNE